MSTIHNLEIDKGGTFSHTITAVDSANNNIFVGATLAEASMRQTPDAATSLADFTCTFAANNASLTISLTVNQTKNIKTQLAVWDLRVTYPSEVTYPIAGAVTVKKRVTRAT